MPFQSESIYCHSCAIIWYTNKDRDSCPLCNLKKFIKEDLTQTFENNLKVETRVKNKVIKNIRTILNTYHGRE